jgi:type II secretory pathway pseudopilin PulG
MGQPNVPEPAPGQPQGKKSAATCLIIGICVGVGGLFVLGVLAALLLPAIAKATERAKATSCANNLRTLWTLQQTYALQFGGREKQFPAETGAGFWLKLEQTAPPIVDASERDLFLCPCKESGRSCDYLGPRQSVKSLKSDDAVGGDHPGNHKEGGNILRKDGSVVELNGVEFSGATGTLSP